MTSSGLELRDSVTSSDPYISTDPAVIPPEAITGGM